MWSGIIYTRTKNLDYRYIAIPKNFDSYQLLWLETYVKFLLKKPDNLRENGSDRRIWSIFKDENYCVIGLTCMVRDLIGFIELNHPNDYTRDYTQTPIYTFIGCSIKLKEMSSDVPDFNILKDKFKNLYEEHVIPVWEELFSTTSVSLSPNINFLEEEKKLSCNAQNNKYDLNTDSNSVLIAPMTDENNKGYWYSAYEFSEPISLCLGFSSEKDLINSPFMNCTINDINLEPTKTIDKNSYASKSIVINSQNSSNSSSINENFDKNKPDGDIVNFPSKKGFNYWINPLNWRKH